MLARICAAHWGAQRELAAKIGLSQSWLIRIAAGAQPNRKQSLKIEKVTGIPPSGYDEPADESDPAGVGT